MQTSATLINRRVAATLRAELAVQKKTVTEVAARIGRSRTWLSTRLNDSVDLTFEDVELIASVLNLSLADVVARMFPTTSDAASVAATPEAVAA